VTEINIADTIFQPDTLQICTGSHPTLIAPNVPYPTSYEWFFIDLTVPEPVAVSVDEDYATIVGEPGQYYVTLTDTQCGFQVTKDYLINAESCEVIIPNIFTPNGDGDNDFFEFEGLGNFTNSTLKVYNRWGNLIFESVNYNNKWSGEDFPDGTYFYILGINKSSGMEYHEGNVTILRETK